MIKCKEAIEIILSKSGRLDSEIVKLSNAVNRILVEDIYHDIDMPPFNKSAMDGYACRFSDLNNEMEVIDTIYAGKNSRIVIGLNQCVKIMTGAPVPSGADCVFMIEDSKEISSGKIICTNKNTKRNICYKGEDIKQGDHVLKKHSQIKPACIPILASAGKDDVLVSRRPKIILFATGTELVEPNVFPETYQIRNSNAYQLIAQINQIPAEVDYIGILKDDVKDIADTILEFLNKSDIIILTGGISVGDYDYLPQILSQLDFNIYFDSTAIKPGKPMIFAEKSGKFCFGLSGNPVSSFIQFEYYVKPFIYAMSGFFYKPLYLKIPINFDFSRKKTGRLQLIPAYIAEDTVVCPVEFHGSAHIASLRDADCFIEIHEDILRLKKGDLVDVRFF